MPNLIPPYVYAPDCEALVRSVGTSPTKSDITKLKNLVRTRFNAFVQGSHDPQRRKRLPAVYGLLNLAVDVYASKITSQSANDTAATLDMLESFFVRYRTCVCSQPVWKDVVGDWYKQLHSMHSKNSKTGMSSSTLRQQIGQLYQAELNRRPQDLSNERFAAMLRKRNFLEPSFSTCADYILTTLENHFRRKDGRPANELIAPDRNTYEFEHILPRHLTASWCNECGLRDSARKVSSDHLNHIGNLALITTPNNDEAGNHAFASKQAVYRKSGMALLNQVTYFGHWNFTTIAMRASFLSLEAVKLWPLP